MSFSRGANPIWFMNDLVGEPLDNTYYAFFLENLNHSMFQTVYKDDGGTIAWDNPIQFNANGGLPDNIYFNDDLTYCIQIKHGNLTGSPLLYQIDDYQAGNTNEDTDNDFENADNLITNPQFADMYIPSGWSTSTAGTYSIAPGWKLVLTGTGTSTVTRTALAGNSQPAGIGNIPYYITITNAGWSTAYLVQTFENNGAIFANGAIAVAFDALASGASVPTVVSYEPSVGASEQIFNGVVLTGNFVQYGDYINLPISTNSDTGEDAFVDIKFSLPSTGTISFSNIQVIGQSVEALLDQPFPIFQEITYERVVDHEFHVYAQSLVNQPKNSLLTGWKFALNPWQFTDPANTTPLLGNDYTADQTIVFSQAYINNVLSTNNLIVSKAAGSDGYGLQIKANTTAGQFAILQYIDPATIAPYWGGRVSLYLKAKLTTVNATSLKLRARLIYINTLPTSTTQTYPIQSWSAGTPGAPTDPVLAANFSYIDTDTSPSVSLVNGEFVEFSFNKFQLPSSSVSTKTLGVLIYSTSQIDNTGTPDTVIFDDISLVFNDFALPTQPMTFDEMLSKCEYYYEKSYDNSALPGTATNIGAISCIQGAYTTNPAAWIIHVTGLSFYIQYKNIKASNPTIKFYSPGGAADFVRVNAFGDSGTPGLPVSTGDFASGSWITINNDGTGRKATSYDFNSTSELLNYSRVLSYTNPRGTITFHYTADARIGK